MKCGHADHEHSNIAEVRACISGQTSLPVPSHTVPSMTENQRQFLVALLEQTGEEEPDLDTLNREQASAQITRLLEKKRATAKKENTAVHLGPNVPGEQVSQGTYTVIMRDLDDDGQHVHVGGTRITLRFRVPNMGRWKGTQLVEYLAGPDNTSDYIRCANWAETGYRVWARFREDGRVTRGIEWMVTADKSSVSGAGYTYSLESGNCYRCGRTLTVPTSIHRGLGPDCAEMIGVA